MNSVGAGGLLRQCPGRELQRALQDRADPPPRALEQVEHVEWATLTYVDWFNNRRIHNEIGKIPPAEFEANYYRQNTPAEWPSQTPESL